MKNERQYQERFAVIYCDEVYRYHYVCRDGTTFSTVAPSEEAALRVLTTERPGIEARCVDRTIVPLRRRDQRLVEGVPAPLLFSREGRS